MALIEPILKEVPRWLTFDDARERLFISTFTRQRILGAHIFLTVSIVGALVTILRWIRNSEVTAPDGRPMESGYLVCFLGILVAVSLEVAFCIATDDISRYRATIMANLCAGTREVGSVERRRRCGSGGSGGARVV